MTSATPQIKPLGYCKSKYYSAKTVWGITTQHKTRNVHESFIWGQTVQTVFICKTVGGIAAHRYCKCSFFIRKVTPSLLLTHTLPAAILDIWHRWCAGLLTVGIIFEQLKQLNRDKHLLHGAVSSWTASVASVPFATRTA